MDLDRKHTITCYMQYLRSDKNKLYSTSADFFICHTLKESQIALFAVRSTSNTLQQAPNGVPARLYVSERVVGGAPATINARPAQRATKRKLRSEAYILSSGPTHTPKYITAGYLIHYTITLNDKGTCDYR